MTEERELPPGLAALMAGMAAEGRRFIFIGWTDVADEVTCLGNAHPEELKAMLRTTLEKLESVQLPAKASTH